MSRAKRNAAAEDYFNRAPNYSAEAIGGLLEIAGWTPHESVKGKALLMAGLLESAHKFVLPDYGMIFGGHVTEDMIREARLPYPVIVLEYTSPPKTEPGPGKVLATKRVVLCWEASMNDTPGFWLAPIAYSPSDERWIPLAFWLFLPYSRDMMGASCAIEAFGTPGMRLIEQHGEATVIQKALENSAQEVEAVVELSAALACTNVTTEVLSPNRVARAAKPASMLFDYHVLMIRPGAEHATSEDKGGTHASPRTHLRRGHIRRLAWGPRVWVNSCVVNPSATGTVNKDYAVRRKP